MMLQAEPLDQVISQAEAQEQDRKKPDPPRQYGIHLNAALTIQTRRRHTSILPKDLEELRAKYDVLSNCRLRGQQRQPGRALYSDVDTTTFSQILKELLGKKRTSHSRRHSTASYSWPLRGHIASRTSSSCVERHTRSAVNRTWDSEQRGGRRTETLSTACCIGCSWSARPTHLLQPKVSRSRVLYRRRLRHNSGTAVWTRAGRPEVAESAATKGKGHCS